MRHGKVHRKLNRTAEHRKAMFANMCAALIKHEQIVTTLPKAKDLRPIVEKLVTLGKRATCTRAARRSRRCATSDQVKKLFDVLGAALQGAPRRLHPRPQGRLPLRRQRADGGDRVRRSRRRRQGQGFRSAAGRRGRSGISRFRHSLSKRRRPGAPPFLFRRGRTIETVASGADIEALGHWRMQMKIDLTRQDRARHRIDIGHRPRDRLRPCERRRGRRRQRPQAGQGR